MFLKIYVKALHFIYDDRVTQILETNKASNLDNSFWSCPIRHPSTLLLLLMIEAFPMFNQFLKISRTFPIYYCPVSLASMPSKFMESVIDCSVNFCVPNHFNYHPMDLHHFCVFLSRSISRTDTYLSVLQFGNLNFCPQLYRWLLFYIYVEFSLTCSSPNFGCEILIILNFNDSMLSIHHKIEQSSERAIILENVNSSDLVGTCIQNSLK